MLCQNSNYDSNKYCNKYAISKRIKNTLKEKTYINNHLFFYLTFFL